MTGATIRSIRNKRYPVCIVHIYNSVPRLSIATQWDVCLSGMKNFIYHKEVADLQASASHALGRVRILQCRNVIKY